MVVICNEPYPNPSQYDNIFEKYPYELSDFQKYSIQAIIEKQHVLVTAHTGSGKTLPAEFAIQHFKNTNKKIIYTSPIKALSNQKYHEFTNKYPDISFGLFTGDIKTNPEADVLIMTTEILMNYLFTYINNADKDDNLLQFQINIQEELACVIFDEVHYINDSERGQVWEKTILMLPPHVQMIMLSATIDNPAGFAKWCEKDNSDKQVYLSSTNHRVVPLSHFGFMTTTENVYKTIRDKVVQQQIRDNTNKLIPIQDHNGKFNETGFTNIIKINKLFSSNNIIQKRKHVLNKLALFLRDRDMLPAIAFVFSRKQVEVCAHEITIPLFEQDSKVSSTVRYECEQIIRKLSNYHEYLSLPEYQNLVSLLERGIGIHHSGMIPILREIVELMISKRYIKLLFATESFAIGLDCPIKTAIFTSLTKFDGNHERFLLAHEYTQMAGRAGRRGIDTVGYVVHCNNLFNTPTHNEYMNILGGVPQKLVSKYYISYSLILNLLKNGQNKDFHLFSSKSMIQNEINKATSEYENNAEKLKLLIDEKQTFVNNARTSPDICAQYIELVETIKNSKNKKRKNAEKDLAKLNDNYKNIISDVKRLEELNKMNKEYQDNISNIEYTNNFIKTQTDTVTHTLVNKSFIEYNENEQTYSLTNNGIIASNIAEIHPLINTILVNNLNNFENLSSLQIVGLFSCFTDIKVSQDVKVFHVMTEDNQLKNIINNLQNYYNHFDDYEGEQGMNTGIHYSSSLQFDIIDISMKWCLCNNVEECKYFIQTELYNKSISVGDFTKAMLKIVTICNEWKNIFEMNNNIDALHKISEIEPMILKYITTSQSLYV